MPHSPYLNERVEVSPLRLMLRRTSVARQAPIRATKNAVPNGNSTCLEHDVEMANAAERSSQHSDGLGGEDVSPGQSALPPGSSQKQRNSWSTAPPRVALRRRILEKIQIFYLRHVFRAISAGFSTIAQKTGIDCITGDGKVQPVDGRKGWRQSSVASPK